MLLMSHVRENILMSHVWDRYSWVLSEIRYSWVIFEIRYWWVMLLMSHVADESYLRSDKIFMSHVWTWVMPERRYWWVIDESLMSHWWVMSHRTCGTTATMLTTQVSTGRYLSPTHPPYLSPTHLPLSLNPYLAWVCFTCAACHLWLM